MHKNKVIMALVRTILEPSCIGLGSSIGYLGQGKYKFKSLYRIGIGSSRARARTRNALRSSPSIRVPVPVVHLCSVSSSSSKRKHEDENHNREIYKDQDDTWVDRHFPESLKPYAKVARIDRPVGTWLLLFPGWWSIAIAAPAGSLPDFCTLGLFGIGAFVMRGAGCTINDLWDRDIDGKVSRTKNRPFASGKLSVSDGLLFLAGQLSVGLAVLSQLNYFSIALGAASLLPVTLYPLAKRYTNWPQVVLGLTFNWGALLGWAAVKGSLDYSVVLPLYASGVSWTLMYDTLYAHQDKADDKKLGLKSTALTLGEWSRPALAGFGATSLALLALSGYEVGLGRLYYLGLIGAGMHFTWQISTANFEDRLNLTKRFVSNQYVGGLVFASIVAGKLIIF
mmetsp:Transcript_14795/g.17339  ORF Transcript_14795/g.17339 Transcript_14795/m.17339 type:complete len:395 (-) Transcript_14795:1500-2684(-)